MDNIICMLLPEGAVIPMKIKIVLRVLNAIAIISIYKVAGLDWVVVYGLIVVIADLDAISDAIEKRCKK